jgi:apolipoprotein N-acyltransferase
VNAFLPFLLSVFSALLLALGYAPFEQAWAGYLGLVPLALVFCLWTVSWKRALVLGFVFGLVHFGFTLFWINEVTHAGWVALALILACYPALWALLWSRLVRVMPEELTSVYNLICSLLGASAWVITEWVRGWLFTGFPWNNLGVTQVKMVAILQIADLGGVLLVSWLVMFVNLILALTLLRLYREIKQKQKARSHYDFSLSMVLVALAFGYGARVIFDRPVPAQSLNYLAVQPNLPQDPWGDGVPLEEAVNRMAQLTLTGVTGPGPGPDLIVWPETPVGREMVADPLFREFLQFITGQGGHAFLFGSNLFEGEKVFNSAMLYQQEEETPQIYRKQHLVIMGEYVPLGNILPVLRKFVPLGTDFSAGGTANVLNLKKTGLNLAPLICFEDTVEPVVRGLMGVAPVDCFINITNDGWFNRSPQSRQHINNALFRCVEYRRPMLRVANNGVTAVISEKGFITQTLRHPVSGSGFEAGTLRGSIGIPARQTTVYARTGNWVVGISVVFLAVFWRRVLLK